MHQERSGIGMGRIVKIAAVSGWLAVILGLAIVGLATVATAQQPYDQQAYDHRNEIGGLIGRVFISDEGVKGTTLSDPNIHFGEGLSIDATYGLLLTSRDKFALTAELPFVYDHKTELYFGVNLVPASYSSFFVTPAARINIFPKFWLSPWASVGGGLAHFGESSELIFGGPNPGQQGTTTSALELGVGADVKVSSRFTVRGEVRDFYTGIPDLNVGYGKSRQHNYFVGGGVVWHF